tara:strand:- start:3669 stop:3887 length:219 start_codon:yes stop_codon:yes gene_type:complete
MPKRESFDFGFSTVAAEDLSRATKAQKLYDAIVPLLDSLRENPEKDYIYWPNREEKVREFHSMLQNIFNSED